MYFNNLLKFRDDLTVFTKVTAYKDEKTDKQPVLNLDKIYYGTTSKMYLFQNKRQQNKNYENRITAPKFIRGHILKIMSQE